MTVKPRIFVAMPLGGHHLDMIKEHCDVDVFAGTWPITAGELAVAIADVDGVLGSAQLPFPREVLDTAPRLRAVCNVGVGYDNVDLTHATKRGVVVANTPGILSDAVADLVLGLAIIMARRLRECEGIVREGRWATGMRIPLGTDLRGKTLAIIGFGRIGREVATRAAAFKMRVRCYDARDAIDLPAGVDRAATLEEILVDGDIVSLHVDLNSSTRHLIDADALAHMKPGAFLINTSRGAVVDQRALYDALSQRRIGGAALDVLEDEPPDPSDPLLQLDNVYIVPHVGSATVETRLAMLELAIKNLIACVTGQRCDCIVNPEARVNAATEA